MSSQERYEEKLEHKYKKDRRYQGRSEYLGAFGVAGVFTFVGIVSLILNATHFDFIGLRSWGYWMFIPAFFIWIGGISNYVKQKRLRQEVLAVLEAYPSGVVNVENLTKELMMERPSLMRLLLDLRVERLLKFRVDTKSGDLIMGESYVPPVVESPAAQPSAGQSYCPQCGQALDTDSMFCPNCGASAQ